LPAPPGLYRLAFLLVTSAGLLAGLLGLPEALLRGAGLAFVPFVALVAWTAFREPAPTGALLAIIVGNVIWVAASLLLLISGYVAPTLAGYVRGVLNHGLATNALRLRALRGRSAKTVLATRHMMSCPARRSALPPASDHA